MSEAAKRMMEKWGWSKGQGLGKDNRGMTSCLTLRKMDGSSSQARIEQMAPEKEAPGAATGAATENALVPFLGPDEGPEAKKRRIEQWSAQQAAAVAGGAFDIDPREKEILGGQTAPAAPATASGYGIGINGTAPTRRVRVRQYVKDDWRWSKGNEVTRYFEEVQLPKQLLDLARKILGEGSRYPARITDDTDCVVEVTAWDTLLVRPRGTGARIQVAKRMLYEVLHPHAHDLREEALISPEEMASMAESALENTTNLDGDDEASRRMAEGLKRSKHGLLNRVGIGAEDEAEVEALMAAADADAGVSAKPTTEIRDMELATSEDAALVKLHLEDLRIATGVVPVLIGLKVKMSGKEKQCQKAMQLLTTLVQTGEWVALKEGFLLSGETKEKKRGDGPAEQILIKVPEGPVVEKIDKHLKAMERASVADQLKLTSKAVNGKRTLMVEGTKAAHERVKLIVKELCEKGESPMLTKELGVARAHRPVASAKDIASAPSTTLSSSSSLVPKPAQQVISAPAKLNSAAAKDAAPVEAGVVSAPPKLTVSIEGAAAEKAAVKPTVGVGMRRLPPPKLAAAMAAGEDLFAGLPSAAASGDASAAAAAAADAAPVKAEETAEDLPPAFAGCAPPSAFPPEPPSEATAADASAAAAAMAEQAAAAAEAAAADEPIIE
eukprot:TRINITY_DN25210_c0_g1_i1.p1 TRINITY_DN25210_c0_g1~~TRINITY_DN25210_c0_g1_i1.p1  ORF type:complete len:697 (+),score=211.21 TRINITY_DN25210_c0_g1_i1:90-2093(+)